MALPAIDPASRLVALIDKAEPELRTALRNAFSAAKGTATIDQLVGLLDAGRAEEAVEVAARIGAVRISQGYAAIFTVAGTETSDFLTDILDVVVDFDQVNFRAVRTLQAERLRLITEFTAEQRLATRAALVDGTRRGLNPRDQARNFRDSIGLTSRQEVASQNFRRLLERGSLESLDRQLRDKRFDRTVRQAARTGEPLSTAQVDRMVGRYRDKSLIHRSEVIARTEALRAVHQGNDEGYRQAIEQGAVDKDQLKRTWVDSSDDRVRDSHEQLDGMIRGIDETFPGQAGELRFPGDPQAPATETVQCRCALATRINTIT